MLLFSGLALNLAFYSFNSLEGLGVRERAGAIADGDVFASLLTLLPHTCRKEENPGVAIFISNLLFPKR